MDGTPEPPTRRVTAYVAGVGVAAIACIVAALLAAPAESVEWWRVLAAVAAMSLLHLLSIPIPRGDDIELVQLDEAVIVPVLLLLEPPVALLVVLVGVAAGQALARTTASRAAFNASQMVVGAAAAAGVVYVLVGAAPGPTAAGMAAVVAGMAALFVVNQLLVDGVLVLATGMPLRRLAAADLSTHATVWASNVVAGLIFAVVAVYAPWLLLAMLLPLVALDRSYRVHLDAARSRLESERLKDDFIATVSHELRTPLTTVKGMIETMRRPDIDLPDRARDRMLDSMAEESERLETLVSELLDLRRLMRGEPLVAAPEPVRVDQLLARVVHRFADANPAARVELQDGDAGDRATAMADPSRLRHVVEALLDNATRHGAQGEVVEVWCGVRNGRSEIDVRDRGPGIGPEELDRIFQRFYVTADSSTRQGGGTGIGLFMARTLVEEMGGSVRAASKPGRGSTFTISLPLAATDGEGATQA